MTVCNSTTYYSMICKPVLYVVRYRPLSVLFFLKVGEVGTTRISGLTGLNPPSKDAERGCFGAL